MCIYLHAYINIYLYIYIFVVSFAVYFHYCFGSDILQVPDSFGIAVS